MAQGVEEDCVYVAVNEKAVCYGAVALHCVRYRDNGVCAVGEDYIVECVRKLILDYGVVYHTTRRISDS